MEWVKRVYYDKFDLKLIIGFLSRTTRELNIDIKRCNCEKALDYLHAIYKVQIKVFIINVIK
ncbi:uncharacterized protein PgNI_11994 [Pyricularia grisea]|uniref:Uncharacterized protein n=1 Tax=Pyricularia grisea TaxID=148305 RepID=A0A6P8AQE6_PYRGI|nr:uncharacterized protein PgNI_11994 [Pyricularia grisea]TLD04273.1 hypothetical protein PgNI_11994 [Pyricularia grisea]